MRCAWCSAPAIANTDDPTGIPHCGAEECVDAALAADREASRWRWRVLNELAPLPSDRAYDDDAQVVPDAVRGERLDWTRPVEGWLLF